MKRKKLIAYLMRNQPESFHGSKADWRKLVIALIEPPDRDRPWEQDESTGEWTRGRA